MAPKEDMLPPGWEDIDRYADRLIETKSPIPDPTPYPFWNPPLLLDRALWNPSASRAI